jgi:hypothetical protein
MGADSGQLPDAARVLLPLGVAMQVHRFQGFVVLAEALSRRDAARLALRQPGSSQPDQRLEKPRGVPAGIDLRLAAPEVTHAHLD